MRTRTSMKSKEEAAAGDARTEGKEAGARKEIRIGAHIKHARLTNDLTLRQLADLVGCSESFVSKIEHDQVRPSFSTLHKIVAALDMNVAELFSEAQSPPGPVIIMRPNKRPIIRVNQVGEDGGIALERLIPNFTGTLLQANIHHINPGANTDGAIDHRGEEFGYILDGTIELVVENISYRVHSGESFSFASHLPHSYSNPGTSVARVLWVNTPPTF